jgi:hypothetical protein
VLVRFSYIHRTHTKLLHSKQLFTVLASIRNSRKNVHFQKPVTRYYQTAMRTDPLEKHHYFLPEKTNALSSFSTSALVRALSVPTQKSSVQAQKFTVPTQKFHRTSTEIHRTYTEVVRTSTEIHRTYTEVLPYLHERSILHISMSYKVIHTILRRMYVFIYISIYYYIPAVLNLKKGASR